MCTSSNRVIIENVIDELAQQNRLFTAYDVTSIAKERGADENHWQMKGVVHDMWPNLQSNWSYARQVLTIPTSDSTHPQCFVYFPSGEDPYEYDPQWRTDSDNTQFAQDSEVDINGVDVSTSDSQASAFPHGMDSFGGTPVVVGLITQTTPTIPTASVNNVSLTVTADKRGRVNLTSNMVRRLGLKEGHTAIVYAGMGKLWVRSNYRVGAVSCKEYIVDCDDSVRLGAPTLQEAGLPGDQFEVSFNKQEQAIEVEGGLT